MLKVKSIPIAKVKIKLHLVRPHKRKTYHLREYTLVTWGWVRVELHYRHQGNKLSID